MRFSITIAHAFVALCLSSTLSLGTQGSVIHRDAGLRLAIRAPQNAEQSQAPAPTTGATIKRTTSPTLTATGDVPKSTERSVSKIEQKSASKTNDPVSTNTGAAPVSATEDLSLDSNLDSNATVYSGGLPIVPSITPGMSVAGVILMITGLALGLVGIKIKRLYIFLSTAFLISLAVAVLIVYVMNPPVKNAIQGAYVVACTITGLAAGGLAVVFPEVTESLGCLLGGFCMAMWFLILKPGGLITETYGKIIMIAAFSLVIFALAFHRITKPYSLIFSLSFAGATATMLGIDCFSRAGMKEFWLYIWALNNDRMFPLGTNNYPHTRGIRVEIAGIVILTALGYMSQVKLWKIVKERRALKDAEKRAQEADLEAVDEETGRRVEELNEAERKQWEAVYGKKDEKDAEKDDGSSESRPSTGKMSKTDSGLGDEFKNGDSSQETFVETDEMRGAREEHIQMVEMGASGAQASPAGIDEEEKNGTGSSDHLKVVSRRSSRRESGQSQSFRRESTQSSNPRSSTDKQSPKQKNCDLTLTPTVIPLPLPKQQDYDDNDSDRSSIATAAYTDRLSGQQTFGIPPRAVSMEFDRASSLAATCDDPIDDGDLPQLTRNRTQSPYGIPASEVLANDKELIRRNSRLSIQLTDEHNRQSLLSVSDLSKSGSILEVDSELLEAEKTGVESSEARLSTYSTRTEAKNLSDIKAEETLADPSERTTTPAPAPVAVVLPEDLAPASHPKSKPSSTSSPSGNFEIQTQCSKIVKTFRTNEWAKHLESAEKPDLDELQQEPIESDEKPARLDIEDLQETGELIALKKSPKQKSKSKRKSTTPSPPTRVNSSPLPPVVSEAASPTPPDPALLAPSSPTDSSRPTSSVEVDRRYSNPMLQNTLLSQRNSMVRSRSNLNILPGFERSTPSPHPVHPAADPRAASSLSNRPAYNAAMRTLSRQDSGNNIGTPYLSDDIPLSERQHMLQQSMSQQSMRPQSRSASPMIPQRRETPQPQGPNRTETLNQWREGLRADPQLNNHTLQADQRFKEMLSERNRAATLERQKMQQGFATGDMIEDRMRQKDMLELHREAMRKMQSAANKHVI